MAQTRATRPQNPDRAAPPGDPVTDQATTAEQELQPQSFEPDAGDDEFSPESEETDQPQRRRAGRPRANAVRTSQGGIFDLIEAIEEADFAQNYKLYVYRMEPFTAPNVAEHKYICRYDAKIDVDKLKADHGSGKYFLRLNRKTVAGTGGNTPAGAESISIEDANFPPNIPPGPWLEDQRNRKWKEWFKAKPAPDQPAAGQIAGPRELVSAVKDLIGIMRPNEPQSSQATIMTAVLDAMKTSHNEAFQMFQRSSSNNDPAQMLAVVMQLVEKMKPATGGNDLMTAYLLEELKAARQQQTELMGRLLNQDRAKDPLSNFAETLGAIQSIQESIGTSKGSDWKSILLEAGVKIAEKVAPVLPAMMMAQAGNRQPQPPPAAPGQVAYQPIIQAPAEATTQATAQATAGDETPAITPQEESAMLEMMYRPLLLQIAPAILHHMDAGESGLTFADWFIAGYGLNAYSQVKAAGENNILKAIQGTPELWNALEPMEADFHVFLSDFFHWTPAEPEDDQPPAAAAPAATPAPIVPTVSATMPAPKPKTSKPAGGTNK